MKKKEIHRSEWYPLNCFVDMPEEFVFNLNKLNVLSDINLSFLENKKGLILWKRVKDIFITNLYSNPQGFEMYFFFFNYFSSETL